MGKPARGKFGAYANMRKVSGGEVGKRAQKMIGCDSCNHMEAYDVTKIREKDLTAKDKTKTGSTCPRCGAKTIRLFDSKAEFQRAQELKILQTAGQIEDLEYQTRFKLHAPDFETGNPVHLYDYISDFTYMEKYDDGTSDFITEDVKGGVVTDVAVMKMKHFEAQYGMPVRITQR